MAVMTAELVCVISSLDEPNADSGADVFSVERA
jgi:hypothetical protein